MFHRFLAATFLVCTTATLAAQSTLSFELNRDTYDVYNDFTVVQGDFNHDGKPDLVLGGGANADELTLRLGKGDGTFAAPKVVGPVSNTILDLAAADLDQDGNLDAVALNIDGNFSVFFGKGDGTFAAPLEIATGASPRTLAVGSFFGDEYLDVAVGDIDGNVELFKNDGGKTFVLAKTVTLAANAEVMKVRAGVVSDNGTTDLAAVTQKGAYILWNDGSGNFSTVKLATYVNAVDLGVGDLNQDGMADVVVSYTCNPAPTNNPGKGAAYNSCAGFDVYYADGNDKTTRKRVIAYNGAQPGTSPYAVDVNGDGVGDIVAATNPDGAGGAQLYVWLGQANGTFVQKPQIWTASSMGFGGLAAGDFNRDGMMDFAMALPGDAMTEIYINSGPRAPCATSQISPTVTVCQPVDNTYANRSVRVQANAYDTTKVTAIQEYVDNKLVYAQDADSMNTTFTEAAGPHFLVTKAWDAKGLSFRSDRHVTVYNGTPGATCAAAQGTASICVPEGTSGSSPMHIVANGAPAWVPTAAQLYINGDMVVDNKGCDSNGDCGGGTSYVDTTQTMASGSYDLVFKLWDADGNVYEAQKTITVP
ncbi:MAG TPA: VCBS repeat-containing protein [Acidobacteriaceae bacterium]|jgi:hypothetical protein|nr:VCBS repeat-containing protein [Acidobacteriaceae bacterium]